MTSKRVFSSFKKHKLPVGDIVPVIGFDEFMQSVLRQSSSRKPRYELEIPEVEDGLTSTWRSQGHHKSFNFHFVGIELGARCSARSLWKKYVADAQVFVLILHDIKGDVFDYFYSERVRSDIDFLLNQNDTANNILILMNHSSVEDFENESPLHPTLQTKMSELEERHCVARFHVSILNERGMEPALDWLTDHLSPVPEVKKSRSALHWLAEVGKKVLTFGAASKKATGA